jgi:hypothetical protein
MGDVHGQLDKLVGHLRNADLIDDRQTWIGADSKLWFVGDFFDRGPSGLKTIDLIRRWQHEAEAEGGEVGALIGNHELLILAARVFSEPGGTDRWGFKVNWEANGGNLQDFEGLNDTHIDWVTDLAAVAQVGDRLILHADSRFYLSYGRTVEEVNAHIRSILLSKDARQWAALIEAFCSRHEFDGTWPGGRNRAIELLVDLGGRQIVHGHTPIDKVLKIKPQQVREPLIYAGGVVVNVDGGMYRGGPGFLYRLAESSASVR